MVASRDWPGSRRTSTKRRASCSSVVVVVVVDVATVSVTVSKSSCSSARRTGNTWRRWRTNCGRWPSTATSRSRLTSRCRHGGVTSSWRRPTDVTMTFVLIDDLYDETSALRPHRTRVDVSRNATVSSSVARPRPRPRSQSTDLGPDLQNVLRQSYDYLTITTKLRSTCDGRLICKTPHKGRWAFLR